MCGGGGGIIRVSHVTSRKEELMIHQRLSRKQLRRFLASLPGDKPCRTLPDAGRRSEGEAGRRGFRPGLVGGPLPGSFEELPPHQAGWFLPGGQDDQQGLLCQGDGGPAHRHWREGPIRAHSAHFREEHCVAFT